jgi:hypothetical protein
VSAFAEWQRSPVKVDTNIPLPSSSVIQRMPATSVHGLPAIGALRVIRTTW